MTEKKRNEIADALWGALTSPNECDSNLESANIVDGLFAIARALQGVASALHKLGLADAATPRGAMEVLSGEIKLAADAIASAIESGKDGA